MMAFRLALVSVFLLACSERVYDRFDGSAWPDRRPRVTFPDGGAPAALLTNTGSDELSVVDLRGPELIGQHSLGLDPVAIDGPHHLAVDPNGRYVYTVYSYPPPTISPGPHASHGTSVLPGIVVKLSLENLRVLARNETDPNPGDIVLTPDGRRVIVTHFNLNDALQPGDGGEASRRSTLRLFDADDLAAVGTVRVCIAPHGVAVSADSRTAFVACNGSDEVAIVALDQPGFPTERIPVGPGSGSVPFMRYGPYGVTLSSDGTVAYVNDLEGRDVREFDVVHRRFDPRRVVSLRAAAFFPAFGPGEATLLIPTQGPDALILVRRDTMEIVRVRMFSRAECERPHQASRGPDGRYYLLCEGDHRGPGALLVFDPETLEIRARVTLGVYPDAMVFHPGVRP